VRVEGVKPKEVENSKQGPDVTNTFGAFTRVTPCKLSFSDFFALTCL
jgi:hypothetical protein